MSRLKSLKEFDNESNRLSTEKLKNVSGGLTRFWTEVTGVNGDDRQPMAQKFRLVGTEYYAASPPYATGPSYSYP